MAGYRIQGPVCSIEGTSTDDATSSRAAAAVPGPVGEQSLTPEQQQIALDIVQLTLDIVGILEPTPFADGTNALISLARADWLGAGLSAIGIIPYIGDLAKAGKLPAYVQKLHRAIDAARADANFARYLEPVLRKLKDVLDAVPVDDLSPGLAAMVESLKRPIHSFLGGGKVARRLSLTDRLLIARIGNANVKGLVRENIETAASFFVKHKVPEHKMIEVLSGIDIHKQVKVVKLDKGDRLIQYADGDIGSWFVKAGGGVGAPNVGIAKGNRQTRHFRLEQPIDEVLQSSAASVDDAWTKGREVGWRETSGGWRKPKTRLRVDEKTGKVTIEAVRDESGKIVREVAVGTHGGGTQYFVPRGAIPEGGLQRLRPGGDAQQSAFPL